MTDREELTRVVARVLARRGPLQTWQLVVLLGVDGWERVTLSQVQAALDDYQGSRFEQTSTVRRRYGKKRTQAKWRLTDHAALFDPDLRTDSEQMRDLPPAPFDLRPWQQEALDAWRAVDRKGVVEAVTGSGKTRVGIAAAFEELWDGGLVTVLTPRVVLVRQWAEALREALPGLDVEERHSGGIRFL